MANKEKLLASAQKNLQKNQVAKAIKDFQKVVELDPRDVRNRQKLAELYSRVKNNEQALSEYEAVAKYYAENGFYLKSIAVYKQMQKLDPSLVNIYHRLAELNEKQGLKGNALAEYRSLVAYYEKQQMVPESINVLQKMKDIDPENLNIRVKIAETYVQAKMSDKARAEVLSVHKVLMQKKDFVKVLKLFEIFRPMFPDDPEMQLGLGQALVAKGETDRGLQVLQDLVKEDTDNPELLRSLIRAYQQKKDVENVHLTYQKLLKLQPEDLELREGWLQSCLDAGKAKQALDQLEDWKDAFFDAGKVPVLKELYEKLKESLPDDPRAGKTLHSIYEVSGEGDKLFDIISDAPEKEDSLFAAVSDSPFGGDALDDSILDEAVEDLDSLEELELPTDAADPAAEEKEAASESVDELSFDLDEPEVEEELEEIPLEFLEEDGGAGNLEPAADEELELELELELENDLDDLDFAMEAAAPETASGVQEVSPGVEDEAPAVEDAASFALDVDEDLLDINLDDALSEAPEKGDLVDVSADLEEAEFYLQQGLLDDAERVCRGILEAEPTSGPAKVKLEEVEKKRQEALAASKGGFVDLGAAIMEAPVSEPASAGRADRFGLDTALGEFKKGVQSQIDVDDCESHYNLGIAYKEMGLIDDAIAEFDHALRNPERRVDCLTLKGVCLIAKGEFDAAEASFKAGLAIPDLSEGEKLSLQYELGLLFEASDKHLEALDCFQFVAERDLFYRNVGDRVAAIRKQLGLDLEEEKGTAKGRGGKDRVSYV